MTVVTLDANLDPSYYRAEASAGDLALIETFMASRPSVEERAAAGKYRWRQSHRRELSTKIAHLAECRSYSWSLVEQRTASGATVTADQEREWMVAEADEVKAEADLDLLVENVGQFSTIDNALLIGPDLEVLCAGYPIDVSGAPPDVFEASTIQGDPGAPFPLSRHGSRHRAAAVFAHTSPGGIAFLCSQDGDVRCLHRPVNRNYVLLWNLSDLDS